MTATLRHWPNSEDINRLQGITDENALRAVTSQIISRLGFSGFAYVRFCKGQRPDGFANYRQDWQRHYLDEEFLYSDPIIRHAKYVVRPFVWEESVGYRRITKAERRVLDEGRDFGITGGACVPVHAPGPDFASFSVFAGKTVGDFHELWYESRYQLQLVAFYVDQAFSSNVRRQPKEFLVQLTPRETECLLWTSRGKTAWEISRILRVSEHTVEFHLRNCAHKLKTASKHHAVVKAIVCGLIYP